MSVVSVSAGRARNCSHVQLFGSRPPSIENVHLDSGVCGVGPADSTGKSAVTYWPGGTRPAGASTRLRWKPRETGLMSAGYAGHGPVKGPPPRFYTERAGSRRGEQVHVQPDDQDRD